MNNGLFSLLKWLYEHPEALRRRFFPVAAVLLFSVVYQLFGISRFFAEWAQSWVLGGQLLILAGLWCYAGVLLPQDRIFFKRIERLINEMRNQEAEDLLRRRPVFMGEAGDVARQIYLVRVLANRTSVEAAYTLLGGIRRLSLLPKEKQQFRMATARVMYVSGNYERFEEEVARIDESWLRSSADRNLLALLRSNLAEINGEYSVAKRVLEKAIEEAESDVEKLVAWNDLARLEDRSGHMLRAKDYYLKSWDLLLKEPRPHFFYYTGHNLMICYARAGELDNARQVLDHMDRQLDKANPHQYLQLLNDRTTLARQLGDRDLLQSSYEDVSTFVMSRFSDCERFKVDVSELRMRLGDEMGFREHFEKVFFDRLPRQQLSNDERVQLYRELWTVCTQGQRFLTTDIFGRVMPELVSGFRSLEAFVDDRLRSVSPELPSVRDYWFGNKSAILKAKLADESVRHGVDGEWQTHVVELFGLLEERCSLWSERKNRGEEINVLIGYCDEYMGYAEALHPARREKIWQTAIKYLVRMDVVMRDGWPFPGREQFAVAVAYLHLQLSGDKEKAKYWIELFDAQRISLLHHQEWFRKWYEEVKRVVGDGYVADLNP